MADSAADCSTETVDVTSAPPLAAASAQSENGSSSSEDASVAAESGAENGGEGDNEIKQTSASPVIAADADAEAEADASPVPDDSQPGEPSVQPAAVSEPAVAEAKAANDALAEPAEAAIAEPVAKTAIAAESIADSVAEPVVTPEPEPTALTSAEPTVTLAVTTSASAVPPPRTPHVARSGSISLPAAQVGSLPRVEAVAPFMPPPSCDPALFHSPALRYSLADALAVPSVRQQAAGGESTVVFQPLQGGSMMFDLSAGSVLIEDYSAPPPHTHTPLARSSANQSAPPTVAGAASASASSTASASASSSSSQSTTTRVFSSMFSSFSSLFGQTTLGLLTGRSPPPGKAAPATERSASPSPSPSPSLSSSPSKSASSSPPASASASATQSAVEAVLSEEEESSGFSASGPCILAIARSYVPLPDAHTLAGYYDPARTARGAVWIRQLNPVLLRRQFAPGLYLRLLGARPVASASASTGSSTDGGSGSGSGGGDDDDDGDAPVQTPAESHVEVYIRKDLARTFPHEALFASRYGLSVLFNVLRAFAHFDPAVSYSQGMAFIVGVLMLHYGPPGPAASVAAAAAGAGAGTSVAPVELDSDPASASGDDAAAVVPSSSAPATASASGPSVPAHGGESEELLFFSLVQLMSDRKHNLRSLYSDDCVGLRLILSVFGAALDECDPPLSEHLRSQGVDVSLYATPWFVSCFAYRFSLPFTSACFGHFVNVGLYFLVLCALHVLRHLRPALLSKPFDLLVPFLTMGALADLPADLPDQAFAQGSLPDHLMQRLQPKHTRQSSYKTRR